MKRSLVPEVSRHNSPHAKFRWALSPFRRLENDWPPTKTFIDMHVEIHHLDFTEIERADDPSLHERNRQPPVDLFSSAVLTMRKSENVRLLAIVHAPACAWL